MKCIKLTTALLLIFNLAVFGIDYSSLAFYNEYLLKLELEEKLSENEIFYTALGFSESSLNPDTINTIGAIGMWQFMPKTLKDLGYNVNPYKFRRNPNIFPLKTQKEALRKKISGDIAQLQNQWFRDNDINYLEKYVGKPFLDIDSVTLGGILAACHLGGVYGTMNFFDSGGAYNPKDLYGSNIYYYLKKFSKYNYYEEKPIKEELQCLKVLETEFRDITLLLKQSKLFTWEHSQLSQEKVTVLISFWQKHFGLHKNQDCTELSYLLELEQNFQNSIEEFLYLEAALRLDTDILQEMDLEKWSGTLQTNGKELCGHTNSHYLHTQDPGYFNFILSLYGMLLGTSRSHICLQNFGFKRLKNFPHLGVA